MYSRALLCACGCSDVTDKWRVVPAFSETRQDPAEAAALLAVMPYAQHYLMARAKDAAQEVDTARLPYLSHFAVVAAPGLHVQATWSGGCGEKVAVSAYLHTVLQDHVAMLYVEPRALV